MLDFDAIATCQHPMQGWQVVHANSKKGHTGKKKLELHVQERTNEEGTILLNPNISYLHMIQQNIIIII